MARLLFFRDGRGPAPDALAAPLFVVRLRQTRTRIGRVDDCDVVLPDDAVSRSHCLVDQQDGEYMVVDRSSNGTFLNGERVQRSRLQDGDKLRVGPFTAVCDLKDPSSARPTEEAQSEQRDEELVAADADLAVQEAILVVTRGPAEGETVRLRGGRIGVGATGSKVTLKDPKQFRIIGKPTGRLDARAKSSGGQSYGIDVRLPGMLTAVVAHPPVFAGKLFPFAFITIASDAVA